MSTWLFSLTSVYIYVWCISHRCYKWLLLAFIAFFRYVKYKIYTRVLCITMIVCFQSRRHCVLLIQQYNDNNVITKNIKLNVMRLEMPNIIKLFIIVLCIYTTHNNKIKSYTKCTTIVY